MQTHTHTLSDSHSGKGTLNRACGTSTVRVGLLADFHADTGAGDSETHWFLHYSYTL